MLPTASCPIPGSGHGLRRNAADKDRFFADFTAVFAKPLELGIRRDAQGHVIDEANVQIGYRSTSKKSDEPQAKL